VSPALDPPKSFLTLETLSKSPSNQQGPFAVVLYGRTSVEIANHHHLSAFFDQRIYASFQKPMIVPLEFLAFVGPSSIRTVNIDKDKKSNVHDYSASFAV
jgi:hypothetical protein